MIRVAHLTAACVIVLTACGDPPTGAAPPGTGIVLLTQAPTDTIDALIVPFEVELRDEQGQPKGGENIRFAASIWDDGTAAFRLAPVGSSSYSPVLDLPADPNGRVSVQLKLGTRVGAADLTVTVPSVGLERRTAVLIKPGAPVVTGLLPKDTVIYLGGQARLRVGHIDRLGHATAEGVEMVPSGGLRIENGIVPGERYGHGSVTVTFTVRNASGQTQTLMDSTKISVAPRGEFVAYRRNLQYLAQPVTVEMFQIDGSQAEVLGTYTRDHFAMRPAGAWPAVSPAGDRVAYIVKESLVQQEASIALMHLPTRSVQSITLPSPVISDMYPLEFDPSGHWLYFTRGELGDQRTAWRIQADGEALDQVSPPATWGIEASPSPSPDGASIVYQTNHATSSPISFTLRVRDLTTGLVDSLGVPGKMPRWSPGGDWIAYLDNNYRLRKMRPDGTEQQPVFGIDQVMWGFSWSPDGEWLMVPRQYDDGLFRFELIELASGATVPLWYTAGLAHPNWHRM